tara:strand:- start:5371 stop:5691 length:321 start_codon:yes stop_codon:yes gene_type:complete
MVIDVKLIVIAFITVTIGSIVRVLHENEKEKEKIKLKNVALIYACSLAIGWLCYTLSIIYNIEDWIGVFGIVGGIISIDLVNLVIEYLPSLIKKRLIKKFEDGDND